MYPQVCKQITEHWKTVHNAALKTVLNPIETNGKCLTKIQLIFIISILSSNGGRNTYF